MTPLYSEATLLGALQLQECPALLPPPVLPTPPSGPVTLTAPAPSMTAPWLSAEQSSSPSMPHLAPFASYLSLFQSSRPSPCGSLAAPAVPPPDNARVP
ncbi:hypothetical protein E4T56_gene11639 [Termitomyces sp. T112]|nr:hypothetical protein E4T56_gene11639 [Termitomyces sp. T112]